MVRLTRKAWCHPKNITLKNTVTAMLYLHQSQMEVKWQDKVLMKQNKVIVNSVCFLGTCYLLGGRVGALFFAGEFFYGLQQFPEENCKHPCMTPKSYDPPHAKRSVMAY